MAKKYIAEKAKTIELKAPSKNEFFLVHGYTGSPTDFNKLGQYLHKRFDANVKIMRIIGHGTDITDLDKLNYNDFLKNVEKELKKDIEKGRNIIIGGLCLGSLIAFDLAARYPVKAVISSSASYKYQPPINLLRCLVPFMSFKHIKKPITNYEKRARKGSFNYPYVHLRGFKVISQAKKNLKNLWKKIDMPCILVHCDWDSILHHKGDEIIKKKINSGKLKTKLFSSKTEKEHNLFYSPLHEEVYATFGDFIEESDVLK